MAITNINNFLKPLSRDNPNMRDYDHASRTFRANSYALHPRLSNLYLCVFNFAPEIGSTLIHVRRSDYIKMNEELGENFYIEAIKVAKKEIVDFKFSVFTDDFNWVNNNKIFDEAENIYYSSNSVDDTIEAFSQMLKFENFIVGNSTFSLVAAITKNLDKSKIIIANPWFRNIEKNIDIQEAIKLENK